MSGTRVTRSSALRFAEISLTQVAFRSPKSDVRPAIGEASATSGGVVALQEHSHALSMKDLNLTLAEVGDTGRVINWKGDWVAPQEEGVLCISAGVAIG